MPTRKQSLQDPIEQLRSMQALIRTSTPTSDPCGLAAGTRKRHKQRGLKCPRNAGSCITARRPATILRHRPAINEQAGLRNSFGMQSARRRTNTHAQTAQFVSESFDAKADFKGRVGSRIDLGNGFSLAFASRSKPTALWAVSF
jgi:hypothetical protein